MKFLLLLTLLFNAGTLMAYELSITETNKTLAQWDEYVANSAVLTRQDKAVMTNPNTGQVISINTPNAAVAENGLYFSPRVNRRTGELKITIGNPDTQDIPLIKTVAEALGGIVTGEEGELY